MDLSVTGQLADMPSHRKVNSPKVKI